MNHVISDKICTKCNSFKRVYYREKLKYYCYTCSKNSSKLFKQKKRLDPDFRKKEYKNHVIYANKRYANDIEFRLSINLRNRLNRAIERNSKIGSAVKDLGCSVTEVKIHLEKQFTSGMTWDNYGVGKDKWSVDHIIALAAVDLNNKEDFLKVNHYTNLRPLWNKYQVKTYYSEQRKREK